jgi:hypothetical protein
MRFFFNFTIVNFSFPKKINRERVTLLCDSSCSRGTERPLPSSTLRCQPPLLAGLCLPSSSSSPPQLRILFSSSLRRSAPPTPLIAHRPPEAEVVRVPFFKIVCCTCFIKIEESFVTRLERESPSTRMD